MAVYNFAIVADTLRMLMENVYFYRIERWNLYGDSINFLNVITYTSHRTFRIFSRTNVYSACLNSLQMHKYPQAGYKSS